MISNSLQLLPLMVLIFFDHVNASLMDTGSGKDVAAKAIGQAVKKYITRLPKIKFNTANGAFTTDEGLKAFVSLLGNAEATPYLMNSCPPVLSVGLRCGHQQYSFYGSMVKVHVS